MIPLPEFKKALGPLADQLSDEEINKIRDLQDRLADIIFDRWIKERSQRKNQQNHDDSRDDGILRA